MAATMSKAMMARFMSRVSCALAAAGRPARRRRPAAAARAQHRDAGAGERGLLETLELDERLAVVQNRAQLAVLRVAQIALGLDDEVVGRHPDLELALLGLELFLRE